MLLELAVAAQAPYLITYNVSDFKGADKFNITVIKPRDFLTLIGGLT